MGNVSQEAVDQFQELRDQDLTFPSISLFFLPFSGVKLLICSLIFLFLGKIMPVVEEPLKKIENVHQGNLRETLTRFLKAREWNLSKAHKMKPIFPTELYSTVRDSKLVGMSGYTKEQINKASVHCYVQSHIQINEYRDRVILPSLSKKHGRPITTCVKVLDMTGLKLSALSQIKVAGVLQRPP